MLLKILSESWIIKNFLLKKKIFGCQKNKIFKNFIISFFCFIFEINNYKMSIFSLKY